MQTVIIAALSMFLSTALLYFNFDNTIELLFVKTGVAAKLEMSLPVPPFFHSSLSVMSVTIITMFVASLFVSMNYDEEKGRYLHSQRNIVFMLGVNTTLFPAIIFCLENYHQVMAFISHGDGSLIAPFVLLAAVTALVSLCILITAYEYAKDYKTSFSGVVGVFLLQGMAVYWLLSQ
jgi:hypothetical protein